MSQITCKRIANVVIRLIFPAYPCIYFDLPTVLYNTQSIQIFQSDSVYLRILGQCKGQGKRLKQPSEKTNTFWLTPLQLTSEFPMVYEHFPPFFGVGIPKSFCFRNTMIPNWIIYFVSFIPVPDYSHFGMTTVLRLWNSISIRPVNFERFTKQMTVSLCFWNIKYSLELFGSACSYRRSALWRQFCIWDGQ